MSFAGNQMWRGLIQNIQQSSIQGAMRDFANRYQDELLQQNIAMAPAKFADNVFNHQTGRLNAISQLGTLGLNRDKFAYNQEQAPKIQEEKQRADVGGYLNSLGDREGAVRYRLGMAPIDQILPGAVGRSVAIEGKKAGTRAGADAQARLGVLRQQRLQEAEGAAKAAGTEFDPSIYGDKAIPPKQSGSKFSQDEQQRKAQLQIVAATIKAQMKEAITNGDKAAFEKLKSHISRLGEHLSPEEYNQLLEMDIGGEE